MYRGELDGEFNITGNGKMIKNGPHLFKFSDFFNSMRLIRRENIVFCPTTIHLIIVSPIFHKLLKKLGCGWVERQSVCDHLDVISNVLGALTTVDRTLISIYPEILSSSR